MKCSQFEELIELYLDGEIDDNTAADFEAHMNICEQCRSSFNLSKDIRLTLHSLPPISVPDNFIDRINARIDDEVAVKKTQINPIFRIPSRYYPVAACLILAVVLGFNSQELLREPQLETEVIQNTPASEEPVMSEEVIPEAPTQAPIIENEIAEIIDPVPTKKPQTTATKPNITVSTPAKVDPKREEIEKVKEQIDSSTYEGRVVIASAVEKSIDINEESIAQAEKDIDYRKSYTLLAEAAENKAIANEATLGEMKNVKVSYSEQAPGRTGAFGSSVIVYRRDADKINTILNKYDTRPVGEFFVMSENEYMMFINELEVNGITFTKSKSSKSDTNDIIFKLVIA